MEYKKIKLNSARNCLRYIIKVLNIKEIYIPYYLCSAVRLAVSKENCKINFYHIDKEFKPLINFNENDFILYPNYFGISKNVVDKLSSKYKNLIVDNAHSFYSEPKGIACFNSLRKFFPKIRDGAFLYIDSKYLELELKKDKFTYLYETLSYEEICKNENRVDNLALMTISDCTDLYYSKEKINSEKEKRLKKFNYWKKQFEDKNDLRIYLIENDVPFCYPFLAKNEKEADELVEKLKLKQIPIYRYWNLLPDDYPEKIFYNRLVCIPLL